MKKSVLVLAAAAAALLCAPASKADDLVGGNTTVSLNSSTYGELGSLFTVGVVPPATISGLDVSFPIVGDTAATISHSGGLSLTGVSTPMGVGTTTDVENFIINLTTSTISGTAIVNGMNDGSVTLFDFNSNLDLTLDPALAGALTSIYGIPNISGIAVGTAAINPAPTPEPSSLALLGTALAGAAATMRRRFATS